MSSIIVRAMLLFAVLYYLTSDQDELRQQMTWTHRQIRAFRWMAEQCGKRVISLEADYAVLTELNRTI
jgi:hypothetical protein